MYAYVVSFLLVKRRFLNCEVFSKSLKYAALLKILKYGMAYVEMLLMIYI
jgi:hypothetical protein